MISLRQAAGGGRFKVGSRADLTGSVGHLPSGIAMTGERIARWQAHKLRGSVCSACGYHALSQVARDVHERRALRGLGCEPAGASTKRA